MISLRRFFWSRPLRQQGNMMKSLQQTSHRDLFEPETPPALLTPALRKQVTLLLAALITEVALPVSTPTTGGDDDEDYI